MTSDPAPTPWQILDTSILDAQGRLVAVLAGRLGGHPTIIAELTAASEMRAALEGLLAGLQRLVVRPELSPVLRRLILEHESVAAANRVLTRMPRSP